MPTRDAWECVRLRRKGASMSSDALRKAFEAWLNPGKHAGNVSAWGAPGRYEKDTHQLAWLAWCAALSAPAPAPAEPVAIEDLAHRIAWRYKKSSDPHHSDTYTFNRATLLQFAAALAAPAAPAGWQPIETAPKDGTQIALATHKTAHAGRWQQRMYGDNWWMSGDYVAAFSTINPPTHWMPLPAAPGAPQGDAAHNA